MKYLVTGAAGFIGSHLSEALLNLNHIVIGLDNFDSFYSRTIKNDNLKTSFKHHNYTFIEGDICNSELLNQILDEHQFDVIIHLAAKAGVRSSLEKPLEYYNVNVNGTLKLLEAMHNTDHRKIVFASSSSVYGNNEKTPFSEDDPVDHPISPYAASKRAAEQLCYTFHHLYGFDIQILRYFSVYGPRQRPDMGISKFLDSFMNEKPITMFGDGSTRRDYTFIEDIIRGTLSATEQCVGFEIINLGESKTISLKSLIEEIRKVTNKETEIISLPMQPGDVFQTSADITKATIILQYNPQTNIADGLKKQFEYLTKSDS